MSENKTTIPTTTSKTTTKPDNIGSNQAFSGQQRRGGKFFPKPAKFEGRCEVLKGYIFDCTDSRDADTFSNTTKEIAIHVGSKYDYGADISIAVENLELPTLVEPADLPQGANETKKRMWEKRVDGFIKRETMLEENVKTLYSLVWGQCTENLRAKIESVKEYDRMSKARDGIMLLKTIKSIAFNFQAHKHPLQSLYECRQRFERCRQGKLTVAQYFEKFINLVEQIEHCGGNIGQDFTHLDAVANFDYQKEFKDLDDQERKSVLVKSKDAYLAVAFLMQSDKERFGLLIETMQNNYLQGNDNYPETLTESYNLLVNYVQDPRNRLKVVGTTSDGVAFTNVDENNSESGTTLFNAGGSGKRRGFDKSKITCHRCQEKGHYANECPTNENNNGEKNSNGKNTDTANMHVQISANDFEETGFIGFEFVTNGNTDIALNVNNNGPIPNTWILLDNQSTVDVFFNPDLLVNIRPTDRTMQIHCNAGVTTTNLIGDLKGYGTVWFHPDGIANILSLARVKQNYRVTYDSSSGNLFTVYKKDGSKRCFIESPRGLYFLDAAIKTGNVLVNTVKENAANYSKAEIERATLARKVQARIGRPNTRQFLEIISSNFIPNCPISKQDIINAETIFGPDVGSLKGKTVRTPPLKVTPITIDVPSEIINRYGRLTIAADLMYVNKTIFLITMSRGIKFGTCEALATRKPNVIINALKNVKATYDQRGFIIDCFLMDGEFESCRAGIASMNIMLNITSNAEHVPDIERYIRTVKERARCIFSTLPFKKIPKRMIIEMIFYVVFWLNALPALNGVSSTISPRGIVIGSSIDFVKHVRLEFGSYVQVHEDHDNSMTPRTTGAIALRPTGNVQGGYYFYSLTTGRRINRNKWTTLPMPQDVIDRVHNLARREYANSGIIFGNRHNEALLLDNYADDDSESDSSYCPSTTDSDIEHEDHLDLYDAPIAGVDHAKAKNEIIVENEHENENDDDNDFDDNDYENEHENEDENENSDIDENNDIDNETNDNDFDENGNNNGSIHNSDNEDIDDIIDLTEESDNNNNEIDNNNDIPGVIPHVDNNPKMVKEIKKLTVFGVPPEMKVQRTRNKNNNQLHVTVHGPPEQNRNLHDFENVVLTQYHVNKGLKVFGENGVKAVLAELKQLHDRKVVVPVYETELNEEDKKNALEYLMFLKQKRCGKIKGRGCADGRKQRIYTSKEESTSPTVAIESVMLSCVIDAQEHRDVATADIPGAFMQADMDEIIFMKLHGKMVDLLRMIDNNKYSPYIIMEKNRPVIYVRLAKALYGTLRAALLFWRKLTDQLVAWGFEINPYDRCVANKNIDGKQCTIIWYVDDLKISHVNADVVTNIINDLQTVFGVEAPLTVTRGNVHDYLGMVIDYSITGKVKLTMYDYIKNILSEANIDTSKPCAITPAAAHLFDVNKNSTKLDKEDAEKFHHTVAQLLYLCKRTRPDIQTAIAFLTTRVKEPDTDDYKKLLRVLSYLHGTIEFPLTLESNDITVIKWWVDGSFATHPDMRSHTGAVMTLGKGAVFAKSTRQKLNTRSSTEAELVGVDDAMPQILWTRYFLESQGYAVKENILYQDNKSSILLENNGKASSSQRTRHINIRYYFVTDQVKKNHIQIQYCPTETMVADILTKPLQGSLFRQFRKLILNLSADNANDLLTEQHEDHRSVLRNTDDVARTTSATSVEENDDADNYRVSVEEK
jgi:Reverse transcriptase (RNA-dependent DNA polymerase)/Zinc knuckle